MNIIYIALPQLFEFYDILRNVTGKDIDLTPGQIHRRHYVITL